MDFCFPFGVHHTYDELSVMQPGGCYWVNIQRQCDARRLCRQTIRTQSLETRTALISCGERPERLLSDLPAADDRNPGPPEKLLLFTLPEKKAALEHFATDLIRAMDIKQRLLFLIMPADVWKDFSQADMETWLLNVRHWLKKYGATLFIMTYGNGINKLKSQLISQFYSLSGLSYLHWQHDSAQYQVAWWFGGKGLMANQAMTWETNDQNDFEQSVILPNYSPSVNDELLCLAEKSVLEGAPPLSENWRLLDNNALLTQQGMQTHSATLVFAFAQNEQLGEPAHSIHTLRRQRGGALKIVVREMMASLRYTDERLLQTCGANLVVPHITPLSSFLTLLEGIQGQRFIRYVPATIDTLLAAITSSQLKGPVNNGRFCEIVPTLIENPLMPENGKGILIALRPVPGLPPSQAATLCHMRRAGDLVTTTAKRVYVFLSNCRLNDLDTALGYIFRLPVEEVFSNRLVWHLDVQILTEIKLLANHSSQSGFFAPGTEIPVKSSSVPANPALPATHDPIPLTLLLTPAQEGQA